VGGYDNSPERGKPTKKKGDPDRKSWGRKLKVDKAETAGKSEPLVGGEERWCQQWARHESVIEKRGTGLYRGGGAVRGREWGEG